MKKSIIAAGLVVLLLSGCGEAKNAETASAAATEMALAAKSNNSELLKTRLSEPEDGLVIPWVEVASWKVIDSKIEDDVAKVRMRVTIDDNKKDSFEASLIKYHPDIIISMKVIDGKWKYVTNQKIDRNK